MGFAIKAFKEIMFEVYLHVNGALVSIDIEALCHMLTCVLAPP